MEDLYKTLGVDKDASQADIKKNYQKRARKNHPDKGGDKDKFYPIVRAYDVLSDPERRKRYDETGSILDKEKVVNSIKSDVLGIIVDVIETSKDPFKEDIVTIARQVIKKQIRNDEVKVVETNNKIIKYEKIAKRIKKIGNDNDISKFIENNNDKLRNRIAGYREHQERGRMMLMYLQSYSYEFDEPLVEIEQ